MRDVNCTHVVFGNTLAPFVRAYFFIPRLDYVCPTRFLLDTGSDDTCLHGQLAYKLQRRMDEKTIGVAQGVGGTAEYYYEKNSIIIFYDSNGNPFELKIQIKLGIQKIAQYSNDIFTLPSVIGRNIMNQSIFGYNITEGIVNLCFPDSCVKDCSIPVTRL